MGSSLILLFEEKEASSPVAVVAELAPGKMVARNMSTAVTPTTSKTMKTTVGSAQCPFVRDGLALWFFEQQPWEPDLVLEPLLEVDE